MIIQQLVSTGSQKYTFLIDLSKLHPSTLNRTSLRYIFRSISTQNIFLASCTWSVAYFFGLDQPFLNEYFNSFFRIFLILYSLNSHPNSSKIACFNKPADLAVWGRRTLLLINDLMSAWSGRLPSAASDHLFILTSQCFTFLIKFWLLDVDSLYVVFISLISSGNSVIACIIWCDWDSLKCWPFFLFIKDSWISPVVHIIYFFLSSASSPPSLSSFWSIIRISSNFFRQTEFSISSKRMALWFKKFFLQVCYSVHCTCTNNANWGTSNAFSFFSVVRIAIDLINNFVNHIGCPLLHSLHIIRRGWHHKWLYRSLKVVHTLLHHREIPTQSSLTPLSDFELLFLS